MSKKNRKKWAAAPLGQAPEHPAPPRGSEEPMRATVTAQESAAGGPTPTTTTNPPGNHVPELEGAVKGYAYRRWGIGGLVVVAVLYFIGPDVWTGIKAGAARLAGPLWHRWNEAPLPKADPGRFAVALCNLERDTDGEVLRLLIQLLNEFNGVQTLRFNREISLEGSDPEAVERVGHEKAQEYLKQSGAEVLILGMCAQTG